MGFQENITACHRCPLRQYPCGGPCACFDGADIINHAEAGHCPHPDGPRYGTAEPPGGWNAIPPAPAPQRASHAPQQPSPQPVPRGEWPLRVRALALLSTAEDRGIGDTAKRVLSHLGADAMAKLYRDATGRDCGCADRQARLNALFRFDSPGK
jgi:hypothetical protein